MKPNLENEYYPDVLLEQFGWQTPEGAKTLAAEPVSRRTRFTSDQVMAAVGAVFLILEIRRLIRMARAAREARD